MTFYHLSLAPEPVFYAPKSPLILDPMLPLVLDPVFPQVLVPAPPPVLGPLLHLCAYPSKSLIKSIFGLDPINDDKMEHTLDFSNYISRNKDALTSSE